MARGVHTSIRLPGLGFRRAAPSAEHGDTIVAAHLAGPDVQTPAPSGGTSPDADAGADPTIWARLSELPSSALANLIGAERIEVIALICARLTPESAAGALARLPGETAAKAVEALAQPRTPSPRAVQSLAEALEVWLSDQDLTQDTPHDDHAVRILEELAPEAADGVLTTLEKTAPDAARRLRNQMFGFSDIARFDALQVQTLVSLCDRSTLAAALSGPDTPVKSNIMAALTTRGKQSLSGEIALQGSNTDTVVAGARRRVTQIARELST